VPAPPAKLLTISSQQINGLPLRHYRGPISIVTSAQDVVAASLYLREETLLGFDTESRPSFRVGEQHPVSLLQLAGEEHVFLFQLQRLDDLAPLFAILANPGIRKVGVAIQHDVVQLQKLHTFTPRGFTEIGDLARGLGVRNTGLRTLCAMFLGYRVAKGAKTTNWANAALTDAQVHYAATDAWASRQLYVELARGARPLHTEPVPSDDDDADDDDADLAGDEHG
jgi:ribonuclease D